MSRNPDASHSRLIVFVENFAEKHQGLYLNLLTIFSLVGYIYLLFWPLLAITALYFIVDIILVANSGPDWVLLGSLTLIVLIGVSLSLQLFCIKFTRTKGFKLSEKHVPDLFSIIAEVRSHYKRPSIRNVVLTDCFELRMESIPYTFFPFLTYNNLLIGLPLLQTITSDEFRCELSRCVGQHSGLLPRKTLFIYKAQQLWCLYSDSFKSDGVRKISPLNLFFRIYSRIFKLASIPAVRLEELNADLCALDYVNDREVLATLKSESISRSFLELHYWPSVRNIAVKDPGIPMSPFTKLEKVMRSVSSIESRKKWLDYAFAAEQLPGDYMPILKERMEYIGHVELRSIPESGISAAEECLGKDRKRIISIIDKLWRSTTLMSWVKECLEQSRDLGKIKELSRKSRKKILWPKDIICYACLARKLNGSSIGSSVAKLLKRNVLNMTPAFIVNRMREHAGEGDLFS